MRVDRLTGETVEYASVSACVKAMTGRTSGSGRAAFIKAYIDGDSVLRDVFTFHYKHPKRP